MGANESELHLLHALNRFAPFAARALSPLVGGTRPRCRRFQRSRDGSRCVGGSARSRQKVDFSVAQRIRRQFTRPLLSHSFCTPPLRVDAVSTRWPIQLNFLEVPASARRDRSRLVAPRCGPCGRQVPSRLSPSPPASSREHPYNGA